MTESSDSLSFLLAHGSYIWRGGRLPSMLSLGMQIIDTEYDIITDYSVYNASPLESALTLLDILKKSEKPLSSYAREAIRWLERQLDLADNGWEGNKVDTGNGKGKSTASRNDSDNYNTNNKNRRRPPLTHLRLLDNESIFSWRGVLERAAAAGATNFHQLSTPSPINSRFSEDTLASASGSTSTFTSSFTSNQVSSREDSSTEVKATSDDTPSTETLQLASLATQLTLRTALALLDEYEDRMVIAIAPQEDSNVDDNDIRSTKNQPGIEPGVAPAASAIAAAKAKGQACVKTIQQLIPISTEVGKVYGTFSGSNLIPQRCLRRIYPDEAKAALREELRYRHEREARRNTNQLQTQGAESRSSASPSKAEYNQGSDLSDSKKQGKTREHPECLCFATETASPERLSISGTPRLLTGSSISEHTLRNSSPFSSKDQHTATRDSGQTRNVISEGYRNGSGLNNSSSESSHCDEIFRRNMDTSRLTLSSQRSRRISTGAERKVPTRSSGWVPKDQAQTAHIVLVNSKTTHRSLSTAT